MVILRFEHPYDVYAAGQLAGFTERAARRILGVRKTVVGEQGRVERAVARLAEKAEIEAAEQRTPRPEPERRLIRFVAPSGRYGSGDIAAFPPKEAALYVTGADPATGRRSRPSVAVYHDPELEIEVEGEAETAGEGGDDASAPRRRGRPPKHKMVTEADLEK